MHRDILAVVAGYAVFAVSAVLLFQLSGQDPHQPASIAFIGWSTVYALTFAVLGGRVATRLSRSGGLGSSVAVCILMAAGAAATLVSPPGAGTLWSQTIGLVSAPVALVGGLFASRRADRPRRASQAA